MSSTTPLELTAAVIIGRLEGGEYPPEVVRNIAAGFLPLAQEDLIAVLAYLAQHAGDEELQTTARASLNDVPARSMAAFAANEAAPPRHLEMLMEASEEPPVLEALIRNRAVGDEAVAALAARADAVVQEIIAINHSRILRAPQILDALEGNPALTQDVRRRILETREEFFAKKARLQPVEVPPLPADLDVAADLSDEEIADLLTKAKEEEAIAAAPAAATVPELPEGEKKDPEKMSVFSKILTMTVAQKVQLGFKGGKTERMILVRDRNRLVCSAVMRNPRMNDSEVESIAGMRNVDDEVLRLMTMKREWMAKYSILLTLVKNPKAPIGIVLPLINRLTLRDLKGLKDDKGVPEAVRASARKLFAQRNAKN
jgi:hypothetical protein